MAADIITVSRILFSLLLFVFPSESYLFTVLYILCGVTDMLDGFVARKLHTESKRGAMLDSMADIVFAVAYAFRILPLMLIPLWIWIWTGAIAVIKTRVIVLKSKNEHGLSVEHSFFNKLTGLSIFLLPLSIYIADIRYSAAFVCIIATFAVLDEICKLRGYKKNGQV